MIRNVLAFIFVWAVALSTPGHAQMLRCIEDSPERRGQPGCSVVVEKRLPAPLTQPVIWHIDEFTSLAAAAKAVGPNGVAFEAHGSAWLYTIESEASNHHGGKHRAVVGPLPVQPNRPYAIQVLSSYFLPGMSASCTPTQDPRLGGCWKASNVWKLRRRRFGHAPVKAPS